MSANAKNAKTAAVGQPEETPKAEKKAKPKTKTASESVKDSTPEVAPEETPKAEKPVKPKIKKVKEAADGHSGAAPEVAPELDKTPEETPKAEKPAKPKTKKTKESVEPSTPEVAPEQNTKPEETPKAEKPAKPKTKKANESVDGPVTPKVKKSKEADAKQPDSSRVEEKEELVPVSPVEEKEELVPVELSGHLVTLHIYNVGESLGTKGNTALAVGTGAFHAGVEVCGKEWSYGYCEEGSGIFSCAPMRCEALTFREAFPLRRTDKTEEEIDAAVEDLRAYWHGASYDLLQRNCCVFSDTLCRHIGVGGIPEWILNLAGAAASLHDAAPASRPTPADVVAAARAGQVDQKYGVGGGAKARAKDVVKKGKVVDERFRIAELVRKNSTTSRVARGAKSLFSSMTGKGKKADSQPLMQPEIEFVVTLDRTSGAKLGIDMSEHGEGLCINAVKDEGLVCDWNASNPGAAIKPLDRIIDVCGVSGDGEQLVAEIRQHKVLEVTIVRCDVG